MVVAGELIGLTTALIGAYWGLGYLMKKSRLFQDWLVDFMRDWEDEDE